MLNLHVFPDNRSFVDGSADFIADVAASAIAERGRFTIALSGGGTPKPIYARLAAAGYRDRIPWEKVHIFFGDERCVPPDDARSNYRMAREAWFDHSPIPAENIHRIRGEDDPGLEALRHEQKLRGCTAPLRFQPSISSCWAWATMGIRHRCFQGRPPCANRRAGWWRSTSKG